jgi:D-alanyl-D-alanine carboxypeptidase (penicillin-binding protein 5/6)
VTARAVVIQDAVGKSLLADIQGDRQVLPASTTKIMTALVARDTWPNLDETVTVQSEYRAIGQTIELQKGETLTVRNLLRGLLIHSGNDAALALADNYCVLESPAGGVGACGYDAFVDAMNAKARALHLAATTYKNPSGIEQYGHVTTARDLAVLASAAMQDPVVAEIVSTKFTTITDVTGTITHPLESTNELLGEIPGIKGLKTGWTENAGECLVTYIEQRDHPVIIVVMGSADRFGDTRALVDWVYRHHTWVDPQ